MHRFFSSVNELASYYYYYDVVRHDWSALLASWRIVRNVRIRPLPIFHWPGRKTHCYFSQIYVVFSCLSVDLFPCNSTKHIKQAASLLYILHRRLFLNRGRRGPLTPDVLLARPVFGALQSAPRRRLLNWCQEVGFLRHGEVKCARMFRSSQNGCWLKLRWNI